MSARHSVPVPCGGWPGQHPDVVLRVGLDASIFRCRRSGVVQDERDDFTATEPEPCCVSRERFGEFVEVHFIRRGSHHRAVAATQPKEAFIGDRLVGAGPCGR